MRFTFSDAARARRLAKLLRATLAGHGVDWPLHACREAVAEACGYPNFHEIEASAGRVTASAVDAEVPAAVRAERREAQRAALMRRALPDRLVDAVLAAVPFTGAFGPRTEPSDGIPAAPAMPADGSAPTPRQGRIARSGSARSAARAGNFNARTLLDADGAFLGIAFGTDMSLVHDEPPDAFLEAFGTDDAATTVGAACFPPASPDLVAFSEPAGAAAMLHLNPDWSHYVTRDGIRPEDFTDASARVPWRAVDTRGRLPDLVTAWSHSGLSLAAFGERARARLRELRDAALSGDLAMAWDRRTGPVLVVASRLDPELGLDALAEAALAAVIDGVPDPDVPRGSVEATLAIGLQAPRPPLR